MHLRNPPKFQYVGMTIILSNPSRFDDKRLLTGAPVHYFAAKCLQPQVNEYQCDVRLIDDPAPLLDGTKVILLCGEKAHRLYTKQNTTLDAGRGSPNIVNGIPCISTFSPQDAVDFKDYETKKNPLVQSVEEFLSEEIEAGEIIASKGRGKTARANYKWWLQHDTKKAIRILENNGKIPEPLLPTPSYHLRPSSNELIAILLQTKGDTLHIDIETDFHTLDIRCIAFSFESRPQDIWIFPVLDIYYRPAYDNIALIFRALAIAFRDNTTVAHNGALFDFFIFAYKYHIPPGRKLYDTMIAQHRIYPDIEKSLGHSMTIGTYEPYHKNEGNHSYRTNEQADQLMYYCGKDVYGMMLLKEWQEQMMEKDECLRTAISWSMRAIRPYLIQSYLGMKYNEDKRQAWIKKNDRLMKQQLRFIKILMGTDDLLPLTSNKRAVEYFHEDLGYDVVKRSAKTGGASLAEEALLKLKAKYPGNLAIDFLIRYRGFQKETGTLNFRPWIRLPTDVTDYSELLVTESSED